MTLERINDDDLNGYDLNGQIWRIAYLAPIAMTFEQTVGSGWLSANVMVFEQTVIFKSTWTSDNVMVFEQGVKSKWNTTNVMVFEQDVENA